MKELEMKGSVSIGDTWTIEGEGYLITDIYVSIAGGTMIEFENPECKEDWGKLWLHEFMPMFEPKQVGLD